MTEKIDVIEQRVDRIEQALRLVIRALYTHPNDMVVRTHASRKALEALSGDLYIHHHRNRTVVVDDDDAGRFADAEPTKEI